MEDEFLTVPEVAELLKLNQMTIGNWIARDELPAVRHGERRVRVKRSDLERLIEDGYTRPGHVLRFLAGISESSWCNASGKIGQPPRPGRTVVGNGARAG